MQTLDKHTMDPLDVDPQDHDGIVDALYRFGAGQDRRDRALLESAFSAEASSASRTYPTPPSIRNTE